MNKKNIFRTVGKSMATMLFAATVLTGFNSCVANEDNAVDTTPQPGVEVSEPYVEPTEDQLEVMVTADMPTAVLTQFDENTVATSLIKRLTTTTTAIDDNTKLALLDGSQVKSLTEADYFALARVLMNGGYIALHRPTFEEGLSFGVSLNDQFDDVLDAVLKENGVESDDEAGQGTGVSAAATRSSSSDGGEMVRRINNACALTRSGEEIDENTVIDELMVFSINANYLIPPYSEEMIFESKMEDEQGQETTVEHKVKNILNAYHYGRLADGAASWLNTKEKQKAEAQQPAAARARTRAGGDQVINSILSATDEFTVSGGLWAYTERGKRYYSENRSNTTIRSWGVHDFNSNRDFYYVEEDHQIRMGGENSDRSKTLYWGPYRKEDWLHYVKGTPGSIMFPALFTVEGYEIYGDVWEYFYGCWLDESIHTMNMTGAGEIKVEKSLPTTDNNSSTEIIAIGKTDVTSHTSGWSFGGSVDKNGPSFNFSYSDTNTETHSTNFTMSTSQVSKDLAIKKNTDGTKVTWDYAAGHTPTVLWDNFWHEMAAPILTSDCDIENKVCWSVKNPSGSYKLNWYRSNWTKAQFVKTGKSSGTRYSLSSSSSKDFTLTAPRRFKKEWRCAIKVNGENLTRDAINLLRVELQNDINPTMFSNRFDVAEAMDDGVEVIKYNVGVASKILDTEDDLREQILDYAESLGIEKFTIKWYTQDPVVKQKQNPFIITVKVAN